MKGDQMRKPQRDSMPSNAVTIGEYRRRQAQTKTDRMPLESEASLLSKVTDTAHLYGWKIYHTWSSKHSASGFPDLVLAKDGRLIFAELKRDDKGPDLNQQDWLSELGRVHAVEVYLWRPRDFDEIERVLGAGSGG